MPTSMKEELGFPQLFSLTGKQLSLQGLKVLKASRGLGHRADDFAGLELVRDLSRLFYKCVRASE